MKKIIAILLCGLMIASGFGIMLPMNAGSSETGVNSMYTPHAPIRINSNADFPIIATAGNGTSPNPWIIENWEINGTGEGYCIYVGNTTEYFEIRNCFLHDASDIWNWPDYTNSGLTQYNVQNGNIINNTISSNEKDGIRFESSNYSLILNNIINLNTDFGIHLSSSSSYNIIDSNQISFTGNTSIHLGWNNNNYNTIKNNNVSDSFGGIAVSHSDFNTVDNNIASSNSWCGIVIEYSDDNSVTNNTVFDNNIYGIYIVISNDMGACDRRCGR